MVSLVARTVKNLPAMQETWVPSLGWEDPLEKEMGTHSSILAWEIPQTEEPGGFMGSQRVGYDWMTNYNYEMETVWSSRMVRLCFLNDKDVFSAKENWKEVLLEINQRVTPSLTYKMPTLKYSFRWQNGTQGLHSENTFKQILLGSKVGAGLREIGLYSCLLLSWGS